MPTHLIVGLSGVGKSTVLEKLQTSHSECEVISFSRFAIDHIREITGASVTRSGLSAALSSDPSLRLRCTRALEEYIKKRDAEGLRLLVDSGGSLVNLEAGTMISVYSLFARLRLCSVSAVLCEPREHLRRLKTDKEWHQRFSADQLRRKTEDLRSFAMMMALRTQCSLLIVWNEDIEQCARTLFDGTCRAETALSYLHEK